MNIIFTLIVCILIYYLFTLLAKKLNLSTVVALIIAGILMGSPLLGVILEPNIDFVLSLGDAGLIFLMFLAGMEVSWSMLYKERKDSVFVAFFTAFTPFLIGFIIFLSFGFSLLTSLTVGICMSITAEATKARVLFTIIPRHLWRG